MTRTLAVLGAGGHGRVVADCAEAAGWDRIVFCDDNPQAKAAGPWVVAGRKPELLATAATFDGVVAAIGANRSRLRLTRELAQNGARLAAIVHPRATVSSHARIEVGSVVFAGAVVNIGARLGQAVIVNTGATVDHDCVLEDGVHVSPGAHLAGGVMVGRETWVGIGAAVREGIAIGHQVCVGAGAVVVKPVADGLTVVGNPARPLNR